MIRVDTILDHIRGGYKMYGWCETHGHRDIDLHKLVEMGLGNRNVVGDFPNVMCALCGKRMSVRRTPPDRVS